MPAAIPESAIRKVLTAIGASLSGTASTVAVRPGQPVQKTSSGTACRNPSSGTVSGTIDAIVSCPYGHRAKPQLKCVPVRRYGRLPVPAVEPGISRLTLADRPGELCRPGLSARTHDLPDSSQYGDNSHPQRRMRAVQ
jgi:hypothetical protein